AEEEVAGIGLVDDHVEARLAAGRADRAAFGARHQRFQRGGRRGGARRRRFSQLPREIAIDIDAAAAAGGAGRQRGGKDEAKQPEKCVLHRSPLESAGRVTRMAASWTRWRVPWNSSSTS